MTAARAIAGFVVAGAIGWIAGARSARKPRAVPVAVSDRTAPVAIDRCPPAGPRAIAPAPAGVDEPENAVDEPDSRVIDPASDGYDAMMALRVIDGPIGQIWADEPVREPFATERARFLETTIAAEIARYLPDAEVRIEATCRRASCRLVMGVDPVHAARANAAVGALHFADSIAVDGRDPRDAEGRQPLWLFYSAAHVDADAFAASRAEGLQLRRGALELRLQEDGE